MQPRIKTCSPACKRQRTHQQAVILFWQKVDKTDTCWLWTGRDNGTGYGHTTFVGQMTYVHRLSWTFHHGAIPDGLCVLHRCDVRRCVNPAHLFLGTLQDNADDCKAKGRTCAGLKHGAYTKPESRRLGEKHGCAKLTEADVVRIRTLNESPSALAREFGIDPSHIHSIRNRRAWRHI